MAWLCCVKSCQFYKLDTLCHTKREQKTQVHIDNMVTPKRLRIALERNRDREVSLVVVHSLKFNCSYQYVNKIV